MTLYPFNIIELTEKELGNSKHLPVYFEALFISFRWNFLREKAEHYFK